MTHPIIEKAFLDGRELTELEDMSFGLSEMSLQIRSWLKWQKESRDREQIETDDETSLMVLPCAYWPSRGMLEQWIKTMDGAAVELAQLSDIRRMYRDSEHLASIPRDRENKHGC